jgi:hypothetical protein
MIRKMKVILTLMLTLVMSMATTAAASQSPTSVDVYFVPVHFTFDGKEYAPPEGQRSFIYEGSSYVPLRFVSYSLGKSVQWNSDTYTVTIAEPSSSELISISEYKLNTEVKSQTIGNVDKSNLMPTSLNVYREKVAYVFDGQAKLPTDQQPGFIIDGSLYVPIRFLSESVGKKIDWNPETYTVAAVVKEEVKHLPKEETKDPKTAGAPVVGGVGGVAPGGSVVGGGGGGAAGGGSSAKPTLGSITTLAESRLYALQSSCKSNLSALANQYLLTGNADLIVQGKAKLSACDASFQNIISDVSSQLTSNGYSTDIIQTYRDAYAKAKNDAIAELLKSRP